MPALPSLLHPDPAIGRTLRLFALTLFAAIVIAGSIPGARAEVGIYATGVILHSLAYACLTLLWFLGSAGQPIMRALMTVLTIALMGALDELVQSFLPYRTGAVSDWMVDVSAAVVAAAALAVLSTLFPVPKARAAA